MKSNDRYFVEAVAKALDILESFNSPQEDLTIAEVMRRAGLTYCSSFRLLHTLEKRGYVMRPAGSRRYRLVPPRKRLRVGYAALDSRCPYSEAISRSLAKAARTAEVELLTRDNGNCPARAVANVRSFLDEGVHLVILHQAHEHAGRTVMARCREKKVPVVAIDYGHPEAFYFGMDAEHAGALCGQHIAGAVRKGARPLVLAPAFMGGSFEQLMRSLATGLRLNERPHSQVSRGPLHDAYGWVKQALQDAGAPSRPLAVAALADPLAIAASRVLVNLGVGKQTAMVALGGSASAVAHVCRETPRAAFLSCFPEQYGDSIVSMVLRILAGEPVAAVRRVEQMLLTPAEIGDYYPVVRHLDPGHHCSAQAVRQEPSPPALPGDRFGPPPSLPPLHSARN